MGRGPEGPGSWAAGLRAGRTIGGGTSPSLVNVRGVHLQEDVEGYSLGCL